MSCKSGSKKEEQRHKKTGLLRSARAQKRETKGCYIKVLLLAIVV